MELPATFTKSSFPRWGLACLEKLYGHPVFTTRANATITNAPANPTIVSQSIVIQRITRLDEYLVGAEDNPRWSMPFVSYSDLSFSGETTLTHLHTLHSFSSLFCGTLAIPEARLISALVALPEGFWGLSEAIQEKEEQETIHADTNRVLSFKDMVSALDRISRPAEIEDTPLPFDPDDYPVV